MARYKHYDYNQTKMIPLRFADQIQPGSFEYTLNHVVDNDLDLSVFESRYKNDYNGGCLKDTHKNHQSRRYSLSELPEGLPTLSIEDRTPDLQPATGDC